ncbi:MAG: thioredoxin family protein [Pseudomonadota bacterium]
MHRRTFLAASAAAATLPMSLRADTPYTPGLIKEALARGETVFVGFSADWCGTCKAQERVMTKLRSENPAYDEAMTFIRVDWDEFGRTDVTTSRSVPRRSTLIVLRGDEELGRVVAGTSMAQIKELMDLGLQSS